MSYRFSNKKLNFIINVIYIALIAAIAYLILKYSLNVIWPFILALIISVLVEPFVYTLTNKFKIKRGVSAAFCVLIFYLTSLAVIALLSITLFSAARNILSSLPGYYDNFISYVNLLANKLESNNAAVSEKVIYSVIEYLKNTDIETLFTGVLGSSILSSVSGMVRPIPSFAIGVIITLVSSIFISSSFPNIKEFVLTQFPSKHQEIIVESKRSIFSMLKKYLKSYLLLMTITFLELTVLFLIFKIKPAFVSAFFISLVDILPVFGVGTVLIPWAIVSFLCGDITKGTVLISIYLVVTVVRQIIEPKVIGNNIGLHPLVTLITIYVGFKLFGIIGMVFLPLSVMLIIELNKNNTIHLWKNAIDNENP